MTTTVTPGSKKEAGNQFDVSMGAFDGAKVYELVGLFILDKLKRVNVKRVGSTPSLLSNVKTNIGAKFLSLINKHFPKGSTLHKIFNRYTLKLSYSCMKNMNKVIISHNAQVMKNTNKTKSNKDARTCNCRKS